MITNLHWYFLPYGVIDDDGDVDAPHRSRATGVWMNVRIAQQQWDGLWRHARYSNERWQINQSIDDLYYWLTDKNDNTDEFWRIHTDTQPHQHIPFTRISAPIDFNWIELSIRPHHSSTLFLFYIYLFVYLVCIFLQLLRPYMSLYNGIRFRMHNTLLSSAWYMTIRTFLDGPTPFDCLFIVATTPRNTRPHSKCVRVDLETLQVI